MECDVQQGYQRFVIAPVLYIRPATVECLRAFLRVLLGALDFEAFDLDLDLDLDFFENKLRTAERRVFEGISIFLRD